LQQNFFELTVRYFQVLVLYFKSTVLYFVVNGMLSMDTIDTV